MAKGIIIPSFHVGQVLDLRYINDMPDRVRISTVYMKETSAEWMYYVLSEQSNGYMYISQSQITSYLSKHDAKCYENNMVRELYRCGFRFVKNIPDNDKAISIETRKLEKLYEVANIIVAPGIYPNGDVANNKCGVWVRYNTVITLDGDIQPQKFVFRVIK